MRPDNAAKIGATFVRWGASPATGVAIAAIHHPDATAIIDERGLAHLRPAPPPHQRPRPRLQRMGIGYGDGVGIMCRNHRGFIETTLAAPSSAPARST